METTKNLQNMQASRTLTIAQAAVTAALYTVLTVFAASFNLANGAIQVRFSEALTVLPFFSFAGIPGITVGCLISNIITGAHILDIVFGTFASFLGAVGTWCIGVYFRRTGKSFLKPLAALPPILSNTVIVPIILTYAYGIPGGIPLLMLTVGAGEVLACGVLGLVLLFALFPVKNKLFS